MVSKLAAIPFWECECTEDTQHWHEVYNERRGEKENDVGATTWHVQNSFEE